MVTIHLTGKVTEDRRLIVDLPDSIPTGEVQLTLEIRELPSLANEATARARAKLADANALSATWKAPVGTIPPTEDELNELGTLPPGSPTIAALVDADRDER